MSGKNKYAFLDFYYKLTSSIVPVTRDDDRRPLIKWKSQKLTKKELITKFPIDNYNYAIVIPDDLVIVDVEATKGGLDQLKKLSKFKLKSTYHNITGRDGIHLFFKKGNIKIPHGYAENFPGIEFLGPGKMVTIPHSIHHKTNRPYKAGRIKPLKSNIKKFPEEMLKLFNFNSVDDEPEKAKQKLILQNKFDELKTYLLYIDPHDFRDFNKWVKLLFSAYDLTKGDARGFELFYEWSRKDEKYKNDRAKIKNLWDKVKKIKQDKNDKRNLITWKTIAYIAGKAGAKIRVNAGRLIDEILTNNFEFISAIENDGEYCRYIGEKINLFKNSPKEIITGVEWVRLTEGVLARIQGFVFDQSGIHKNDFVTMRIKDKMEHKRISIFKGAWEEIEYKHGTGLKDLNALKATKEIFFKLIKHKDTEHAAQVFPFFVKYLVSGARANLAEFDDKYRSNSQTCLCISSDRQGVGKSTFARALTPIPEMVYYPNLKNIRDMEIKLAIARASMCIIDDYQPTYQKELNNLNEILTQHNILVRPKYGRIEEQKTKRAYFALTTNYKKILNDFTGTRRWINLDLLDMDIVKIIKIVPRMHGEIIALARSNFRHWFNRQEINLLETLNEPFSGSETVDNILINHYETNTGKTEYEVPAIEIMRRINRAYGNGTVRDPRPLGAAINRLFPDAISRRAIFEGRKITVYNLKLIKPFDDRDIIINGSEASA